MRDADPGLFGPDSVTWNLHGDPSLWIGGLRALYLQALHPRSVRGVMQNSDFRRDPWGRLARTADFISTITYGTTMEAERAAAKVRRIHRRLTAVDPDTGERYRLDEPELLLWIHCAEIDSYLHVARRSGFPLTEQQADAYVDEQRISARLVGLDPRQVPSGTRQLAAYLDGMSGELAVTEASADVLDFVRRPPVPALFLPARSLVWSRAADLAYSSLPSRAHVLYGERPLSERATTRGLLAAGAALRGIPAFLRWQAPPGRIRDAVARLGPGTHPSAWRLAKSAGSPPQARWAG